MEIRVVIYILCANNASASGSRINCSLLAIAAAKMSPTQLLKFSGSSMASASTASAKLTSSLGALTYL